MQKQFFSFFALVILISALLLGGCGAHKNDPPTDAESRIAPQGSGMDGVFTLGEDLYITDFYAYSGPYVEDGSDDACESVAAVRVENLSERHYQYLTFTVESAGETYAFSVSTLFAGASVVALEENRAPYPESPIGAVTVGALAEFTQTPSVHLETLSISYTDGFVNVKNVSGRDITNVYVYYKNTDGTGYLGGITYRASVGDLAAGELRQMPAAHMKSDGSRVVFATYDG